jgi:6-phosphogluconolactonase
MNLKVKTVIALGTILLSVYACKAPPTDALPGTIRFYVGSSDGKLEYSIFLCQYDPAHDSFAVLDSFAGAKGPSYLDLSPDGKTLYAISNEVSDPEKKQMTVSAFRVNPENQGLVLLNSRSSEGDGPCHIQCSPDGAYLFAANYNSGQVAVFPLSGDGRIQPASTVVTGEGTGPIESRQQGPHAHQVNLDPGGHFLLVPDLGTDKILVYAFDSHTGSLEPNPSQPFLKLEPGSGPRHLVFHPSGSSVYVVNELNATVTACAYRGREGRLTLLQTIPTLEESHAGSRYPAAIRMHPGGKYLYASTRGEPSSISLFRIRDDGRISRIQVVEPVPGWPRDFNIEPSGNYLLVAGERAHGISPYRIDRQSGRLEGRSGFLPLPSPGCILFTAGPDQKSLTSP